MTVRLRGLFVIPFIVALAMLLAPSAWADAYTDDVVSKFNAQTHVVADPAATPPLQNPGDVNQQILSSRWTWSSGPPVWVAAVAPSQTNVTTPDAIHNVILGRNAEFSGVILVIDSKGYHVRAYDVPKAIAASVDPIMAQARNDHRGDPYGATSEFVTKLAAVNVSSGASSTTSPVANHRHDSWSWVWVMVVIVGIVVAGFGLIWFVVNRGGKRRKDAAAREQVKQELIAAGSDVSDLDNAVVTNGSADVSAEALKANSNLSDARRAYEAGDYSTARTHLRIVQAAVAKANRKLNPGAYPGEPDVEAVTSVPVGDRKQAQVRAKDPDTGQIVTINNNNYSTTPQPGYGNYYGGGYHNGVFFYPGYYPYSFWGPGWGWALGDVLLMDALLDDRWGGSYASGFEAGRDSAFSDAYNGDQTSYDSQQGNFGFGGNDYSGGGDVSFSGNDSGGGYDSSGGNFDFGGGSDFGGSDSGGGFDSGGGDSGF